MNRKLKLVSAWMILFVVIGLRFAFSSGFSIPESILAYGLLAIVLFAGIQGLRRANTSSASESEVLDFADAYSSAWKSIVRHRWLLRVFGFIALINVLGALMEYSVTRYYLAGHPLPLPSSSLPEDVFFSARYHGFHPIRVLMSGFSFLLSNAARNLLPGIGWSSYTGGMTFLGLAILISLPWINRRLIVLCEEGRYASQARFIRRLIMPVAVISTAAIVGGPFVLLQSMASLGAASRHHPWTSGVQEAVVGRGILLAFWLVRGLVITPMFIGGFAGSLARTARGVPITGDSLLKDSVEFFKPLAGFYALLYVMSAFSLAPNLFQWTILVHVLLTLAVIFVPYTIAGGIRFVREGIRIGVGLWVSRPLEILSFVGFGLTVVFMLLWIERIVHQLWSVFHPMFIIPAVFEGIVKAFLGVFVSVAVWGFYQRISSAPIAADSDAEAKG